MEYGRYLPPMKHVFPLFFTVIYTAIDSQRQLAAKLLGAVTHYTLVWLIFFTLHVNFQRYAHKLVALSLRVLPYWLIGESVLRRGREREKAIARYRVSIANDFRVY